MGRGGEGETSKTCKTWATGVGDKKTTAPNPTGEPVAWVGKTPLRPLGRPQDRSGGPTKGAKRSGGNLPDCRLRAPSPPTTNYQLPTNSAEPLRYERSYAHGGNPQDRAGEPPTTN
ncbi:MAG: hypothetical protein ACHBN1_21365 [Heteroscytonema crispum UTEX LB 1556]